MFDVTNKTTNYMKKFLLTGVTLFIFLTSASAQKLVGGDLSLVPAYEQAGDKWLDADGKVINTAYRDGMITYVHEVAGWNSVRVRLLVDPSLDDAPATCQDLDYVKKLGKRVKDAGMNFLLDIFYSDTWTDVSQQWIPTSWGYDRNTAQATLAAKVKNYTTEVLNELAAYGAKPDYVQIGNEVSYGMLWDSLSGKNKANSFSTGMTYDGQRSKIERFATLLKAAAEGVRASECATAKIVLHCERTINSTQVKNFYSWVQQAGFTDYDIIGLSYYPIWHGTISQLKSSLSALQASFPSKDIHIVETGYYHTDFTPKSGEIDTRTTWTYSPAGQAAFLKDLIAALKTYDKVTGLYYWQPEECGNGADASGNNRVMGNWDNRGFWAISWKSGSHALNSKEALMTLKTFVNEDGDDDQPKDVTSQYIVNATFDSDISGWTNTNGTAQWKGNTWEVLSNYCEFAWTGSVLANQEVVQTPTLPAGTYKLSVNCATDNGAKGVFLIAGDQSQEMVGTGKIGLFSVEFTVSSESAIKLGVKLQNTTATWVNFDNFNLQRFSSTGIEAVTPALTQSSSSWYTLDGRHLTAMPSRKGIYIYNGRKVIVR